MNKSVKVFDMENYIATYGSHKYKMGFIDGCICGIIISYWCVAIYIAVYKG